MRQPDFENPNASTCSQTSPDRHTKLTLIGVCLIICLSSGCQAVHPFTQKTRSKILAAKQWANTGLDAFQNGHLDKAKGFFSRATETDPNDYQNRANLARTLYQSGDRRNAIVEMQQAADHSKGDPRLLIELGEMYLSTGQWLPARRQVELALESNHRFAPAWALSGKTAKAKGDFQQALADFQRALGYAPEMSDVQLEIVDTYQRMGESLRALAAVEQVLSKHPKDEQPNEAIIAKGIALMNLKQFSPAIDLLQTASERDNPASEVFVRLGQAHILAGNSSQARTALNRGKRNFPNLAVFDQLANSISNHETRVATNTTDLPVRN